MHVTGVQVLRGILRLFVAMSAMATTATAGFAQGDWTFQRGIELVSKWNTGQLGEDTVTAELFRPKVVSGRVPGAVIINSSGGVLSHIELHYARALVLHGVAVLVIDSFMPRGARRTTDDQSRVPQQKSDADAVAGFRWLAAQPWVDPSRIIVLGMSRGGEAALKNALEVSRRWLRAEDIRFAAHVAIVPGGCQIQIEDARTTGAPIFFMLAELDDTTPSRSCLDYLERVRTAGNPNVRFAVYPGVYHAFESTAGILEDQQERWKRCRYNLDRDGKWIEPNTGKQLPFGGERAVVLRTCADQGPVRLGGDHATLARATGDLLQFLRDYSIVEDREARAILPDCSTLPEGIIRHNCQRARAGWTGDLVAMGLHYLVGRLKRDDVLAARMFKLAADRGHAQAQWQLAIMYLRGIGVARDAAVVRSLAQSAAAAGEAPAMNILGLLARDGIGQAVNDTEAVRWFEKAAQLRYEYALANLGRMHWQRRGGLSDRVEAVRLWRLAAYYSNPYGHLYLGEALEVGEGAARNLSEALEHYRAAADQAREPDAKRRAADAVKRLGAVSK